MSFGEHRIGVPMERGKLNGSYLVINILVRNFSEMAGQLAHYSMV